MFEFHAGQLALDGNITHGCISIIDVRKCNPCRRVILSFVLRVWFVINCASAHSILWTATFAWECDVCFVLCICWKSLIAPLPKLPFYQIAYA